MPSTSSPSTASETFRKKQFADLVKKASEREIPKLTDAEIETYRAKFYQMRSGFAAWCTRNQHFYTLALLSTCEIEMVPDLPAPAAVTSVDRLAVMFHPSIIDLYENKEEDAYAVMVHELRHLVQVADMRAIEKLVNLDPIRDVFLNKQSQASDQAAKDTWQKYLDEIDKPNSRIWNSKRHTIANITMDAALHIDVLKLFKNSEDRINEYFRKRFVPLMSGFTWETIAKDILAAKREEEVVAEKMKSFGPKDRDKFNDALKANKGILDYRILAELMQMGIHLQTVHSLEDSFRNMDHYQPTVKKDGEWLYLSEEYVKWLAEQINDGTDPNSPPQPKPGRGKPQPGQGQGDGQPEDGEGGEEDGEGDFIDDLMDGLEDFDQHDFGADGSPEKREEAERRIRDALRRAEEEGKWMAHKAGVQAADSGMMGDSLTSLNEKMRKLMDAIRIKFVRLYAPTNNKLHSYKHINRLFSEVRYLPGKIREEKPKPQVVLLVDTSGSCWNQTYFNQYAAFARHLDKQGKLAAMYCFDAELHRIDFNGRAKNVEFKGGGGTVLRKEDFEQVLKDLNLKRNVEFVILTDEEIIWQGGAENDKRWKLHSLNVPRILGERR